MLLEAGADTTVRDSPNPLNPDYGKRTPLDAAVAFRHKGTARQLLEAAGELLPKLARAGNTTGAELLAEVVARRPLQPYEWAGLPVPCPSLAAVLPTVLERSEVEAASLVAHLPSAMRSQMQAVVLSLARAQAKARTTLPAAAVKQIVGDMCTSLDQ